MPTLELALDKIQGNILGGFNKDFQNFLLLKFKSAAAGRAWLKELADDSNEFGVATSSAEQVLRFNAQFKALKADGLKPEDLIESAWTNLAVSFAGMTALGLSAADLALFPTEFSAGMAARKLQIGDIGSSDPSNWPAPFNSQDLHALLVVAADSDTQLAWRVANIRATGAFVAGVNVVGLIEGRTRDDERGHEHFGFKDGVSQPGIRGVTPPDDPIANPDQGHPGQDLLWPGEFVIGYPTQIPTAEVGRDGPNRQAGTISQSGPAWTLNGSYLVFRRLAQNVPAFKSHVASLAAAQGIHVDLMGAKLVGRYKSGCPIEARKFHPGRFAPSSTDPANNQPELADNDTLNNNFEFGDDADGAVCPLAAHIRKAYPRDEVTLLAAPDNSEADTQTHRLLRRGIPFGRSIGAEAGGADDDARGLLFQCYQRSIENQFEFVQSQWVNAANFPPGNVPPPGEDPIIAQSPSGPFQLQANGAPITVQHFVTTTGGEYFFAPSIDALADIGNGAI